MTYKIFFALLLLATLVAVTIIHRRLTGYTTSEAATEEITSPLPTTGKRAVLVELFTSEGCSSCPPADVLLQNLEQTQPVAGAEIIALSEHVDYWNRLGWTDPYSSRQFSDRQGDYGRVFDLNSIYTPQMVVDGRFEFVGSNAGRARSVIAEALSRPKADIHLSRAGLTLAVRIENLPPLSKGDAGEVMLAITESGLLSHVARGENAGRKLPHTAVVRRLEKIGSLDALANMVFETKAALRLEKDWVTERLRAVVFLQERESRKVLGAATLSLSAAQ